MILRAEAVRKNNECPETHDKISKTGNVVYPFY